jgi:hypothetical protein
MISIAKLTLQLEVNIGRLGPMVIEFALDHYNHFLALCDPVSREYEILKNGLVIHRGKDGDGQYERVVEIFAEMRDAHSLLALANKICPAAAPTITKAMSLARCV